MHIFPEKKMSVHDRFRSSPQQRDGFSSRGATDADDDDDALRMRESALSLTSPNVTSLLGGRRGDFDPYATIDDFQGRAEGGHHPDRAAIGGVDFESGQLQVANEQGDALGNYVAPEQLSLNEAYVQFVKKYDIDKLPMEVEFRRFIEQTVTQVRGSSRGTKRNRSVDSLHRDPSKRRKHNNGSDEAQNTLDAIMSDRRDSESSDEVEVAIEDVPPQPSAPFRPDESSASDFTQASDDDYGGMDPRDMDYMLTRFASHISKAEVDEDFFVQRLCPLCGFMNNQHDSIPDRDWNMVRQFISEGCGNMDIDTHAMLLAFMWNKNIFDPMQRSGKRIAKLTFKMAKAHLSTPHRFDKRIHKKKSFDKCDRVSDLLTEGAFKRNPLTGELSANEKWLMLAAKYEELKWKIVGVDDKKNPFASPSYAEPTGNAGGPTNPLQTTKITHR